MTCLFLLNESFCKPEVISYLSMNHIQYEIVTDQLLAIEKAQETKFDVIVLDVFALNFQIDNVIRIFRECNPNSRIIVRTSQNSKELEAKLKKEKIYFYHVESFGIQDFTTALASALQINTSSKGADL